MAGVNKTSKRKRTHRVSQGIHGSTRVHLSPVQKVLLGGGQIDSMAETEVAMPWRGVGLVTRPFDPEQAEINKRLYPWICKGDRGPRTRRNQR